MQVEIPGPVPVELFQESQPFDMGRAVFGARDDLFIQIIERGEQRDRSVSIVIVGRCFDVPAPRGNPGWVHSRAGHWLFSSQHSTSVLSGGFRYRPITSQNFNSNSGSRESLKVRVRCGFRSFAFQIRCTLSCEIPTGRAMLRTLHRRRPFGGWVTFVSTCSTFCLGSERVRPLPGHSSYRKARSSAHHPDLFPIPLRIYIYRREKPFPQALPRLFCTLRSFPQVLRFAKLGWLPLRALQALEASTNLFALRALIPKPSMTKRFLFPVACLSTAIAFGVVASAVVTPAGDWKIAGPFGGTATSLALDHQKPEVLLAGGMNSLLYRSADSGESWALLDFPKRNLSEVTSVLVDPANSSHYLAGIISADGGGLFASHDEGKTWTPVKGVQDFGVRSIVASASKPSRFIAGTLRGVMLSDDSGDTWTRISDPKNLEMGGITATAIDPSNPDILYAGTSHLPWKSTDGGKTWQSIHAGMTDDSDVFSIYVNPAKPENVFASACSGIYTSPDHGDNWRKVMGLTFSQRRTHVIRKDPQAENVIYAGTTMGLFKSPNMGGSWKLLSKEQVNAIVFDPAHPGSMYMAMQYEGLSRASEAGESIKMLNNGFVDRSISAVTRSGDKLIALETQLGETSGIFVSDNRGESWTQTNAVRGLNGVHLKAITGMPSEGRILLGPVPTSSTNPLTAVSIGRHSPFVW